MRQRILLLAVVLLAGGAAFWLLRGRTAELRYLTAEVDRGDIQDVVGATGTLQAVTTVQVGSQVSGTIQSLHADFNSVVKKDEVIARLDPSLLDARLGQARASLVSARANAERAKTTVDDTRQKYGRSQELAAENLLPQSDLETAKANYDGAVAQLKAAAAAVTQADANVNQAEVDLAHSVIKAPIDGVVIARNVDVGQTVAASFQAPVLFVIANDLTRMQVNASIDEADIGRVRQGLDVSFRVDAYPEHSFVGRVEQVRLQPTTVQNVVTYNTLIAVDNKDQRLMPGMTATVSVIIRRAENAVRVPAAALRFRPEGFDERRGGARPGNGPGTAPASEPAASPAAGATASPAPGDGERRWQRPAGDNGSGSERRRSEGGSDRRGGRPDGWARGNGRGPGDGAAMRPAPGGEGIERRTGDRPAASRGDGAGLRSNEPPASGPAAPGPQVRPGRIFVLDEKGQPQPVRIRTGISDGQFVEVVEGIQEGARVVTGIEGDMRRPGGPASANPFAPPQFQRRQR